MPATIDYKKKYLDLRSKYINDIDMSFRLGVEQGMQQAQQQQALDAQAQAKEAELNAQNGIQAGATQTQPGQPEQPGQPGQSPEQAATSSELDQHIAKLESMLGQKPEPELQKSLQAIVSLRKKEKDLSDMKKAEEAIKGIAAALHKPSLAIGVRASTNLNQSNKDALASQHKIVNDVMASWAEEEKRASKDISTILGVENLLKQ